MLKMTFDEYDNFVESVSETDYRADAYGIYWPDISELKKNFTIQSISDIYYLIWLLETNKDAETEEEKEARKYIQKLLYKNLELIE